MKRAEFFVVAGVGGFGYGLCEIIWRGYTHPSMFFLGSICFFCLYEIQKRFGDVPIAVRCISGGVLITSLELAAGMVVNILLGLDVWDYSDMPFNLYGQICPQFLFAWVIICIPAFFLCRIISGKLGSIYAQIE